MWWAYSRHIGLTVALFTDAGNAGLGLNTQR